jgi:thiol-disulfide isomerase/thioredoxin
MRSISRRLAAVLLLCSFTLARAAAPVAGDVPPNRVGTMLKGEPVVLSFWATWCAYCLKELPILVNIQKKVGKERLQVVAINTESYDVFRKVTRHMKDWDMVLGNDPDEDAQSAYGVNGIPHMVIIGQDGKILRVYRGYSESSLPAIAADINLAIGATPK